MCLTFTGDENFNITWRIGDDINEEKIIEKTTKK